MRRHVSLFVAVLFSPAVFAATPAERFEIIKRTAQPAELYAFLYALPKGGDLHNHLSGAVRSEWWYAIATDPARNGGDVYYTRVRFSAPADTATPLVLFRTIRRHTYEQLSAVEKGDYARLDQLTPGQKAEWLGSLRLDRPGEGRNEFFNVIWDRVEGLYQNLHVIGEILAENMKAFGAESVRYLETQQGAMGFTDNDGRPVPPETAVEYLRARLAQPDARATGVTVRFQCAALRFFPNAEEQIEKLYRFVDAHRDLWVSVNLVGIEENGQGYPARFLPTFRELRRRYPALPLSIHAGEMDGPDSHIRDTLLLGASRIGHGVNLIQDPDTLLLLQQTRRVLVEINLISNRLLEYTPDLTRHPLPEYLRTGVPVCLNTDDRGMWDSNMTDEYYTAVTTFNLSWDEIVQLGRNSLAFSFVQPDVKARLLADYERDVAAFEAKFLSDDSLKPLANVHPVAYGYAKRTWGLEFR
jgi:adenosine deaminase CECR1